LQSVCPSVHDQFYKPIIYDPVKTDDVKWTYEKFLIGPDGRPLYRYAHHVEPTDVQFLADIKVELSKLQANSQFSVGSSTMSGVFG